MRLRNWKETQEPTIEETLRDVHPPSLDARFHWYAQNGSPVWVNASDEDGNNRKWRRGVVLCEGSAHYTELGIFRSFHVQYMVKRKYVVGTFTPGLDPGLMKPDTPEVRELLRQAGYFT